MYLIIKRMTDVILSLMGITLLLPVFLILVIAIKIDSKGPVIFKQKRIGIHEIPFNILKFRTMTVDTPKETPTHLLENSEQWITKLGAFLRKTSLDELPQIFNILSGSMAIIGPRPALWNQFDLIAERDKYGANDIRPGLTGWAQINGRDEIDIINKAALDGYYIENLSFKLDVKIFFTTIVKILKRENICEGNSHSKFH